METIFKGFPRGDDVVDAFSFCQMSSTLALALAVCNKRSLSIEIEDCNVAGKLTALSGKRQTVMGRKICIEC